jgi:hypothetical protein
MDSQQFGYICIGEIVANHERIAIAIQSNWN